MSINLDDYDNVVFNIDCIELMLQTPDKYFDLAIVDPPYNVGASDGNFGRGGKKSKIKETRSDLPHYSNHDETPNADYFKQLFRVSKNQIIWGANYYPEYLRHSGWIVWDKMKKDGLLSQAELAYQSINNLVKIYKHEWEGFRKGKGSFEVGSSQIIHPNQKPVSLYRWLMIEYAKEGDIILDTHVGSGSSRIAADLQKHKFIGCEINQEYFLKQEIRYKNHKNKLTLF